MRCSPMKKVLIKKSVLVTFFSKQFMMDVSLIWHMVLSIYLTSIFYHFKYADK